MIRQTPFGLALSLGVAGAAVTSAVGDASLHPVAYALATMLGVITYYQANSRLVDEAIGTILLGVGGGLVLSEVVLTVLSVYVLGLPVDFAAWSMWTQLLFPWAYVLALMLTGYFGIGLLDALR